MWATPFRLAVPGPGPPLTRPQFNTYRQAFRAFRDCVGRDTTAVACADTWTHEVGEFLPRDADRRQVLTAIEAGVPVEGVCLYPILNHPGWDDTGARVASLIDLDTSALDWAAHVMQELTDDSRA